MERFVVRYQHDEAHCPARDAQMGQQLLVHLAPENGRRFGVTLEGDGVRDGQHTLYLIVEAATPAHVEDFMQPFRQAGAVEGLAAPPCEAVVERGGC
jgi:hypothetical protein